VIARAAFFVGWVVSCATYASAQTQITPEQFIDQAEGRTLTFLNFRTNNLVGVEEFITRDRTVWARDDGSCTYGRIELSETLICFHYEDMPGQAHCWMPYVHEGELLVISTSRDIQRVSEVSDDPVVCTDVPVS
jgi:hypothetical protein